MLSMKIILDFDDTILDTGNQVEEWVNIFRKRGFTREEYIANYEKSKEIKGDFDADFMIELFAESKKIDKKAVKEEIISVINRSKEFVYNDFFDFVKGFDKRDLMLVTVGLKEIQEAKVINSGVHLYVNKVSIPLKHKSDEIGLMAKKYPSEKIFFIDDKAKQIDKVKRELPQVIAMKMERSSGRHILPKSELADYTVKNFGEAKKIIRGLG